MEGRHSGAGRTCRGSSYFDQPARWSSTFTDLINLQGIKSSSSEHLPRTRDLCSFLLGILCARPHLLLSLYSYVEDSIKLAGGSFLIQCMNVVSSLGDSLPEASSSCIAIDAIIGPHFLWCRLLFATLQIAYAFFKYYKITKDFHCPCCLDEKTSLFKVVRPSGCHHYGCTDCMHDWMSSKQYNGCPLCRKKSARIVDVTGDLINTPLLVIEGGYICWGVYLLQSGAMDGISIPIDNTLIVSFVALALFYAGATLLAMCAAVADIRRKAALAEKTGVWL